MYKLQVKWSIFSRVIAADKKIDDSVAMVTWLHGCHGFMSEKNSPGLHVNMLTFGVEIGSSFCVRSI